MAKNFYKMTNTSFINPYNFVPVDYKKNTEKERQKGFVCLRNKE